MDKELDVSFFFMFYWTISQIYEMSSGYDDNGIDLYFKIINKSSNYSVQLIYLSWWNVPPCG